MAHTYSIAEARDNLAKIVRESESGPVELTRRGRPVARGREDDARDLEDQARDPGERAGLAEEGLGAEPQGLALSLIHI